MEIRIDRESGEPIYLQISRSIRDLIRAGALPEGFRLPPERRLASSLGVNRSTVLQAYRELKADALVDAHVGRGTTVLPGRQPVAEGSSEPPMPWRQLMRDTAARVQDPLVRDLLEITGRPGLIALSAGLPSPDMLPLKAVEEVQASLLREVGAGSLLHSPTEGVTELRRTLVSLMSRRGIGARMDDVLVTSGSQQGLDLVARVFVDPGDAVVVEEPSFFGALQVFRNAQARLLGVPMDRDGMRTDALEALLSRHRPKLIYTLPTFQNPSGAVLSVERRRHLLELAARYQVPILEDDPYSDLRYEGRAVPSLKALDRNGHVLYLSSFSKVLFPGLRIGWITAPAPVLRQLVLAKQAMDLHASTPAQWLVERFIRDGLYSAHLAAVCSAYRERRDAMEETLRAEAPPEVSWSHPEGGFYLWCAFPRQVSQAQLLSRAAEMQVAYLPGAPCFADDPGENYLRLNFSFPTPRDIRAGVSRLMEAFREIASLTTIRSEHGGTPPIV